MQLAIENMIERRVEAERVYHQASAAVTAALKIKDEARAAMQDAGDAITVAITAEIAARLGQAAPVE